MAVSLSALRTGRAILLLLLIVLRLSEPQGLLRLEGLGILKQFIHLIGSRNRDLPACGIYVYKTDN
jgi:hypothetical protein